MQLGDFVKKCLAPFVKGTKLESCEGCEKRRVWLNAKSTAFADWWAKITCPCFYKGKWNDFANWIKK